MNSTRFSSRPLLSRIYRQLPTQVKVALFSGANRFCPLCETRLRQFLSFGLRDSPRRRNASCPICFSRERHRLAWLFLRKRTDLFDGCPKRLLHVAPESILSVRFQTIPNITYLSADLYDPNAMVKMDITDIQYPDSSFDVIFCSHVLEHVPDDTKAMQELCRVLSIGGSAIIQVPIIGQHTEEDLSIVDPEERKRLYGHPEHVRNYGLDICQRLEAAGFGVQVFTSRDLVLDDQLEYYGLPAQQTLFYASKSKI